MHMDDRLLGKRYERDYTEERLEKIYDDITVAVSVPVNVDLEAEHRVLDLSRVEEIVRGARRIALQDCGCRIEYGNCDAPVDVHIDLDECADLELDGGNQNAREVTADEALDVLRRSHEAGLVHMAYTMKGDHYPKIICSCCPCCCHSLAGYLRFGIAKHVLKSDLVAVNDRGKCTDCGVCVDRCVFKARAMEAGALTYDSDECFGCGLCISTCPTGAISLVQND
jgi:NAD-dependent dihydropyrimidine dehydrogenase PreA subunit